MSYVNVYNNMIIIYLIDDCCKNELKDNTALFVHYIGDGAVHKHKLKTEKYNLQ